MVTVRKSVFSCRFCDSNYWSTGNKQLKYSTKKLYTNLCITYEIRLSITTVVTVNSAILVTKWNTNQKSELKGKEFKV